MTVDEAIAIIDRAIEILHSCRYNTAKMHLLRDFLITQQGIIKALEEQLNGLSIGSDRHPQKESRK